jgi:hypothetical protein
MIKLGGPTPEEEASHGSEGVGRLPYGRLTTLKHPPPSCMMVCKEAHIWKILALDLKLVSSYGVEDMSHRSMGPLGVE